MIKILSIAISAMVVLLVSLFSDPDPSVTLTATVPSHLVPGEDCLISVTVHRGPASGYAQLQQVLPIGWKAKPVELMGSKFEMNDNVASFVWASLPTENEITVSYLLQTDPNVTASASLHGGFVYTEKDQAVTAEMTPVELVFATNAPTTDNSNQVERKIIATSEQSGQYRVELTIHKKVGEHTARYVDNIPYGYTVTNINSGSSRFMFNNGQATFLWDELPAENTILISYTLESSGPALENPQVNGILVYGSDDGTQTGVEPSTFAAAPATATPEPAISSATTEPVASTSDVIAANLAAQEASKTTTTKAITYTSTIQPGVFFKIQIAATRKSPMRSDNFFEMKYHLGQHVDMTEQEGWRKYMVGNFDSFTSASAFNQKMREKIPDAFVVAYRNSERIPVEEAVSGVLRAD